MLGYGGGDDTTPAEPERRRSNSNEQHSQNPNSPYQVFGAGDMTIAEARQIIADRCRQMAQ